MAIEDTGGAAAVGDEETSLAGGAAAEPVEGKGSVAEGTSNDNAGDESIAGGKPPEGDEDQGSEGEGEGGEGEGEEKDEPDGAPEAYEEFVIPEGMEKNEEAISRFSEYAKARNFSQKEAQETLDYYSAEVKRLFSEQDAAWKNVRAGWRDEAKKSEEFGGKAFEQNMRHVATAIDRFGTPELRKVLNQSGVGDNPEVVGFFYRVGKLAGEGEFLTGEGGSSGESDPAKVLYPGMG